MAKPSRSGIGRIMNDVIRSFRRLCRFVLLLAIVVFVIVAVGNFADRADAQNRFTTLADHKPRPSEPYEKKIAPEPDIYVLSGNMRLSAVSGHPLAVYQETFLARDADPEIQARQYLLAKSEMYGLTTDEIAGLRLHFVRKSEAGTVIRLRQMWKGLPVNKNAEITIHINKANVVDFVMNGYRYGIKLSDAVPAIAAETALLKLADHLGVRSLTGDDAKTELMVLSQAGEDRLVYRVNYASDAPVGDWEAFVDAKTGTLIKVEDIAYYNEGKRQKSLRKRAPRPFSIMASGTGNVFDPDPLTTAVAVYGGSYVDGSDANASVLTAQLKSRTLNDITLSAGTYSLTGPYAEIRDFEAPNKGLFTQASSTFNFDRNADAFEAVNCYYHIDASMRYLNSTLGLSIMPYQYVGGVRVDPSGLNGADNSHYLSGSGQLAFGEGGVDDAEDADVIIHELGHGLHDWFTVGGISQVNGLSEGTGDYWAGSYSRALGYWPTGNAAYNWTFNWDGHNPFWGGRILNYGVVYPGGLTGAIHTDGQIWATANMKIWNDIGALKSDKAFWSGLDLTNSTTNQNDAANAVYTASATLGYTALERIAMNTRYAAAGYTMPAPPTAAGVSISGRVLTNDGHGLRNASVSITNATGNVVYSRSSSLGYFRFDEIDSGQTYVISVASKRFTFAPRVVNVTGDLSDVEFMPQ